ncbi:MAG: UxaA family hydrolase [Actinomycetota bacterium]
MTRSVQSDHARTEAVRLHPGDDVLIVVADGAAAPPGHKVAARSIAAGEPVRKSGYNIGVALEDIAEGDHVHVHNLANPDQSIDDSGRHPKNPGERPLVRAPTDGVTFDGYHRADGRVGTRNHLLVLPSVNCSATVSRVIAERARSRLPATVDGVWALGHQGGCGIPAGGIQLDRLRRVLRGYATHPNTGGVLFVGLGCEVNQLDELTADLPAERLRSLCIQDVGGTTAAIDAGVNEVLALADVADADRRQPAPISALVLGLQCGGSDGFSAISANPALGAASDRLVAAGGTVLLSETPELIGAIDELAGRASDPVAAELRRLARWWIDHAAAHRTTLDANPSPGNLAGGISTIVEKSIGAAAKGGTSALAAVVPYAQRPSTTGLVVMDSPGYDPVSATGQIAAGAQVVCFTTGRGSCFGSIPAPAVKLSTTSDLARRLPDDIDVDCGGVLEGTATTDEVGALILDTVVEVASGRPTCSERLGYGLDEFAPWSDGVTL